MIIYDLSSGYLLKIFMTWDQSVFFSYFVLYLLLVHVSFYFQSHFIDIRYVYYILQNSCTAIIFLLVPWTLTVIAATFPGLALPIPVAVSLSPLALKQYKQPIFQFNTT